MNIYGKMITLQEVPDEISLVYAVAGCPLHCNGCSWGELTYSEPIAVSDIQNDIDKYTGYISCVCFLGGEWEPYQLKESLRYAKSCGLKTCLYTGKCAITNYEILKYLDYIKVGEWDSDKGGLEADTTNQSMYDLNTMEDITWKFKRRF